MKYNYKYKYFEEEEDFILTPKTKDKNSQKEQDENEDPYDNIKSSYRTSICIMNPEKKRQQEEYQIRRKDIEIDRIRLIITKKALFDLPEDVVDKIVRMAGFYIPTVLCWGRNHKNKNCLTT
jgi:hypothetical protein